MVLGELKGSLGKHLSSQPPRDVTHAARRLHRSCAKLISLFLSSDEIWWQKLADSKEK